MAGVRLFRDRLLSSRNFVIRLHFVARPSLKRFVLLPGVHVGQKATWVADRSEGGRIHHKDSHVLEKTADSELPGCEPPSNRFLAPPRVDRAQWMIAAFGAWHDCIGLRGVRKQIGEQFGRDKGHITGDDHERIITRGGQSSVEAAKRALTGDAVGDLPDIRGARAQSERSIPGADDQYVVGQARQLIELAFEDRSPVDHEGALIASTEPGRPAAGKNRRARHYRVILPPK
jgi:hypothetical protein